ncbi:MAG: hypothetical protein ACUVR3_10845, partial [Candidatus Roseilinea sp.]
MLKQILRTIMSVVLAAAALPAGLLSPQTAQAAPAPPPGSWPFYRYDMQRTNRVPSNVASANITQPAIKWSFPVGGAPGALARDITGPSGVPDGIPEIIAWGGGRVRAFNSQTGDPIWTSDIVPGSIEMDYIGDVDADNTVEVLVLANTGAEWRLYVLSGASGQVLSRSLYGPHSAGHPSIVIADITGDNKMEAFEVGWALPQRRIFTFQNGAANPTLWAGDVWALAGDSQLGSRGMLVADLNGDGSREALYPAEKREYMGIPAFYRILHPPAITFTNRITLFSGTPSNDYPLYRVTDVLAGGQPELVVVYTPMEGAPSPAYLFLQQIGPAPGYPVTTVFSRTSPVAATIGSYFAPGLAVARLVGGGDREIVWSYHSYPENRWKTEVVSASGVVIATVNDHIVCRPTVDAVADLDGNGDDELVLCRVSDRGGTVSGVAVYDWDGGTLSQTWSLPAGTIPAIPTEPRSARPEYLDYIEGPNFLARFTADFNGDGKQDVALVEGPLGNRVLRVRDVNSTALFTYTPPAGIGFAVRYIGDLDGITTTTEVLVARTDGYLVYLDSSLNEQRSMYAGAGGTSPYVVDTNSDGKNEVIFQDASERLLNLDPITATQQLPPRVNWAWPVRLPYGWHPLDLDNAGLWEYLI